MRDARARVGEGFFGGLVAVVRRAGGREVHADAADVGALALVVGEVGEQVGGGHGEGGEVGGGRGAVGEGAGDDARVDGFGAGEGVGRLGGGVAVAVGVHRRAGVAERGFQGECVGGEPVEEGGFAEDAAVGILGSVDVCVWCRLSLVSTRHGGFF